MWTIEILDACGFSNVELLGIESFWRLTTSESRSRLDRACSLPLFHFYIVFHSRDFRLLIRHMTSRLVFFNTLNTDVCLDIVRKTSKYARGEAWRDGIGSNTLEMLFDRHGPFVAETRVLFPMMSFNSLPFFMSQSSWTNLYPRTNLLRSRPKSRSIFDILEVCCDSLRDLFIRSSLLRGKTLRFNITLLPRYQDAVRENLKVCLTSMSGRVLCDVVCGSLTATLNVNS